MTIQDRKQTTTAELIAEARRVAEAAERRATGNAPLYRPLADALEAAEKRAEENRKEIDRLSRELQVAEDQANTIAGDLAQAERERDNWKLSAEEAEKRWKDRAAEALAALGHITGVDEKTNQITMAIEAQVHAQLALVEQQRIANLIALGQYTTAPGDMPVCRAVIWEGDDLREDIRKGLGL